MNKRPIGVFDSGLGGLTMLRELTALIPHEDFIYLGDTGRVPYGSKSCETILKYAGQDASFLAGLDIKAMVIACNTACVVAYDKLSKTYEMPVYEVVRVPAGVAAEKTGNGKIGVIGTVATIRSGAYEKALKNISKSFNVYSVSCPLFVPLVEEGWTQPEDAAVEHIARRYLDRLLKHGVDTLILGCTHYSLLIDVIKEVMGREVTLIDSGAVTAMFVAKDLAERGMLASNNKTGTTRYYVTDSTEGFTKQASRYLNSDVHGQVMQVTLGEYEGSFTRL